MNRSALLILLEKERKRVQRYFAVMGYEHRLMAGALCCIALATCKKEEAQRAPVVTIIAPVAGSSISVPDALHVVADVSGEGAIDRLTFILTSGSGIPLMAPLSVVPANNPARVEVDLALTSDLITSGDYTLTVQAFSGDAQGKDYVGIGIIGTPLRLRKVLAIAGPEGGSVGLYPIDSTGSVSLAHSLGMDLAGACVSSAAQVFMVAGAIEGPLTAFNPDGVNVRWLKPSMGNSGVPWFTSLDLCEDGRCYAGTTDGSIRGYNASTGAGERVAWLTPGYRARCALVNGERLLVAQADPVGSTWRMRVFQASSGSLIHDQSLDQSVTAMFRRDGANALLFGDRDGHGVVKDHNIDGGGGWEPYAWPSTINAVERTGTNTWLVALNDGSIERFTYSDAASTTIAMIPDVHDLALDPVSGLVFAAAGADVLSIDPQNGQIIASYAIGAPVRHVLPLLNR